MSPLPFLALASMLLDWYARWRANKPLEYVGKPLVILFLIAWLYQRTSFSGGAAWVALALGFSLIGDILLMLPQEQFIGGLSAFLVAQLAYVIAFNQSPFVSNGATLLIGIVVLAVGAWVFTRLAAGLLAGGQPRLRLPLLIYSMALAAMLFSALACLTRPAWSFAAATPVALGAVLFFVSDALHGWDKFVRPMRLGRILVHVTYHLGQFGLTLGVVLHLSVHYVI